MGVSWRSWDIFSYKLGLSELVILLQADEISSSSFETFCTIETFALQYFPLRIEGCCPRYRSVRESFGIFRVNRLEHLREGLKELNTWSLMNIWTSLKVDQRVVVYYCHAKNEGLQPALNACNSYKSSSFLILTSDLPQYYPWWCFGKWKKALRLFYHTHPALRWLAACDL